MLKPGKTISKSNEETSIIIKSETVYFNCLAHLTAVQDNHGFIFGSKLPELLFSFLTHENSLLYPAIYRDAIISFLNLGHNPLLYKKILSIQIF
jgi:hypothetical protein